MADTYTAYFNGIAFAATKNMGAILNTHATEKLKVYRVGLINAQTAAVTGVLCAIELRLYTATAGLSAPTAVTPVKHDSAQALPAAATIGHAGTPSGTSALLRRVFWSSDEAAISTGTLDEWETLIPLNVIWDSGYGDANVKPIVLNEDEMLSVYNVSGAAGLLDVWMEFTRE